MAIKYTWSASLLWEMMLGQALELASLVSKNYCCLSEAIAIKYPSARNKRFILFKLSLLLAAL